ncbi:MAG: N-acetylglucosamine kinase [Nitratireductor sp.]|nr:N-acetylglucosamine kinase [Nitratireductor sp.]
MGYVSTYQLCAVDGGGTGCRSAIAASDARVLARASGGPANYATNAEQTVENVLDAVRQAAAQLGAEGPAMRRLVAHVGLAGIMSEQDARAMAARLPFEHCTVSDDRVTSTIGALGESDGALLAVGTGTFATLRRGDAIRFIGGWGLNLGDQASGARLGRDLLEHTLLAWDGLAPESDLTRTMLARFGGVPGEIVAYARQARPADYATLAPLAVEAARADDPSGRMLMERGAAYLNKALAAMALSEGDVVCLIGGVGPHYEPYLAPEFRARIRPPQGTALDGALQLARRKLEELETSA